MAKPSRRAKPKGRASIAAVEVGGWPALGGKVRLELAPRWTVLFGKNAAGKSALLEGLFAGVQWDAPLAMPLDFRTELRMADDRLLIHEYRREPTGRRTRARLEPDYSWFEKCQYKGEKVPLWMVKNGRLLTAKFSRVIPKGESAYACLLPEERSAEFHWLMNLFAFTRHVPAGVPREDLKRRELVFSQREGPLGMRLWESVDPEVRERRLGSFFEELLRWREYDQETFDVFVELCRRIQLFDKMEFVRFQSKQSTKSEELATLEVDGVNAGLLSDGTLRVMETLCSLLATYPGTLLLIEEPETGIHPGLLSSLLNVIESYSADRQVVFSTHSPLVVSRAAPTELRLVERNNGKTSVRSLSTREAKLAARYLESEGTLGEFVYSGALDDET